MSESHLSPYQWDIVISLSSNCQSKSWFWNSGNSFQLNQAWHTVDVESDYLNQADNVKINICHFGIFELIFSSLSSR